VGSVYYLLQFWLNPQADQRLPFVNIMFSVPLLPYSSILIATSRLLPGNMWRALPDPCTGGSSGPLHRRSTPPYPWPWTESKRATGAKQSRCDSCGICFRLNSVFFTFVDFFHFYFPLSFHAYSTSLVTSTFLPNDYSLLKYNISRCSKRSPIPTKRCHHRPKTQCHSTSPA
jgi:hypothetical protein